MNRVSLIAIGILVLGGYLLVLSWTGSIFASFALTGGGFDESTRFSMVMDVDNQEAIVNRLPVPGYITDMHQAGDRLIVGNMYEGLQVINVSNPLNPQFLWRSYPNLSVLDIEPFGKYFALSCGSRGLRIVSLGETSSRTIGRIYWPKALTESKFFADYLYVAANTDGLLVYDLRDLTSAKLVYHEKLGVRQGSRIEKMLVHQGYLYLSTVRGGVKIYTLSDPAVPKLVNQITTENGVYDMVINHGELTLIDSGVGIRRYSLENPESPQHLKDLASSGRPRWLSISDDYYFIGNFQSGLMAIPKGNEFFEGSYGHLDVGGTPKAIRTVGNYLYVGLNKQGLLVVDPLVMKPKQQLYSFDVPGRNLDLVKDGRWLYVSSDTSGFQVVDLEDEKVVASLPGLVAKRMTRAGQTIYLVNKVGEVSLVNVSDPYRPEKIHQFKLPNTSLNLSVSDSRLIVSGLEGVTLYDVANPFMPQLLDHFPLERAMDATIDEKIVYVAADQQGLVILQITENSKLRKLKSIKPPWPMDAFVNAQALAVKDKLVYLALGQSGMSILDVANPRQPKILGSVNLPGYSAGISIAENFLGVSSLNEGVLYLDVRNPKKPMVISSVRARNAAEGVLLSDGMIFLACDDQGVKVFPVPVQPLQVKRISSSRLKVELPAIKNPGRYSLQVRNRREQVGQDGVVSYLPTKE